MYLLPQESFSKIKPLLKDGHSYPEILSIIECNNAGWIYVDQIPMPKSALVWSKGIQGFYLIGDHTNEVFINSLDDFITKCIEPRMREQGLDFFEVSGHHDKWDMLSIFPSRNLHQFEQIVFKITQKPPVQQDKGIKTINLKMKEGDNQDLKNVEFVKENINQFWSSNDEFVKKGYGFAAMEGSEILGVCYSSFIAQDTHAIGIETLPKHRNRGVATHLAYLLVENLLENGFTPYWDCSLDNVASYKLALRLGFQQVYQYKCSSFKI